MELITKQTDISELICAWQNFLATTAWHTLIQSVVPKESGNGLIYELPNFLNRENESFALADMRNLQFSEPHYHSDDEIEIYFVLQGSAVVVIGGQAQEVSVGDVVIIRPEKAHFVIPDKQFVIAIVNTPPFRPENYKVITDTDAGVGFDSEQFKKLSLQV